MPPPNRQPAPAANRAPAPAARSAPRAAAARPAAPAAAPAAAHRPAAPAAPAAAQPAAARPPASQMKPRSLKNVEVMDFGDESIRGGFRERPAKFKMENGRRYRGRIMTRPLVYYGANVQAEDGSDKGFYALSLADPATAKAALEGDPSALARAKEMCPLFAGGYNIDRRWVVLFHQIGIESRGRVAKQSLVLPWAFGKDKYSKLTEIYNSLKAADGRQIPLSAIELNILCTDTNFQKVDITPILQKHQFMCSYADSLAACANELYDPKNPDAGSPLLDDFLEPDSREDLIRSLNRLNGTGALGAEPAAEDVAVPGQGEDFGAGYDVSSVPVDAVDAGYAGDAGLDAAAGDDAGASPIDDLDSLLQ